MTERYSHNTGHIPLKNGNVVESGAFGILYSKEAHIPKYESYREAMKSVRNRQPWSPENPRPAFARDLRIEVIDKLGIEDASEYGRVRIYTAVKSALDHFHGVDAFIEVDEKSGTITVTLDITTREKEDWKTDICIQFPADDLDPNIDEKDYLAMIDRVADAVVRKVKGQKLTQQYVV